MKNSIRKTSSILLITASLALVSCKDNSAKTENVNMTNENNQNKISKESQELSQQEEVKTTGMAAFKDENVSTAYQNYISLKEALVKTNPTQAAQAASLLNASAPSEVGSIAQEVSATQDINKQRELFSQITAKMEPILEEKLASGEIYKLYCPMAFEGKGDYWFSDSKQIRNPYFGDKMLNCGRVEKTIN